MNTGVIDATALKTAVESGKIAQYSAHLSNIIHEKDNDIKRLCSQHYNDFVTEVENLSRVSALTTELRVRTENFRKSVQRMGDRLITYAHLY